MPSIRRSVLRWYAGHKRDLPWRRIRDPYKVLLSEVMLQQTQVSRVIPKYREFLRFFPTLRALSRATPGRVIARWQGLGYNRRALWLHDAARAIVERWNGHIPASRAALLSLPGIGENTAQAMLVFAFGLHEPVLDVNVRRVLSRLTRTPASRIDRNAACEFLPHGRAYDWNQALMDIGAMICTARTPDCPKCPLRRSCPSSGKVKPVLRRKTQAEPARHGIPRRIYRGRILRAVSERSSISAQHLAQRIGLSRTKSDMTWLTSVVRRLDAEGLVRVRANRTSWSVRRVP